MIPQRIQLSRKKGWKKPENTVVVSRPTKWGNPFVVDSERWERNRNNPTNMAVKDAAMAKECYERFLTKTRVGRITMAKAIKEIRGKNLACWCKPGAPYRRIYSEKVAVFAIKARRPLAPDFDIGFTNGSGI